MTATGPSSSSHPTADQWGDLQSRLGPRVTSTVIEDASHALFPEQPTAVARAVIGYLRTLT
jgi:pimeloyl-ACP methyl ester carboxylesterase